MRARAGIAGALVAGLMGCLATGCSSGGETRLVVATDTLRFYGGRARQPEAHLVGPDGRRRALRDARLSLSSDSAFRVHDGFIRCVAAGEAIVTVERRGRTASVPARCRPTAAFGGVSHFVLTRGQRPVELPLVSVGADGGREPIPVFDAVSTDSAVARVRGRFLHAVGVGRTTVTLLPGGAVVPISVTVIEVIAHDSLRLAPGEFRSWRLAKGRYAITMTRASASGDLRAIEMVTEGARCIRDGETDDRIHCIVYDSGAVAIRHLAQGGGAGDGRAVFSLVRTP